MADPQSPAADGAADHGAQTGAAGKPAPDASKTKAPRKPMKPGTRIVLLLVLVVVIVAAIVWLVHYLTAGRYVESTDDAYIQSDSVAVSPKVSGYVDKVLVVNNQDVKQGQPLVHIDPRDYTAKAAQSQSQIDVAKANADAVTAQIREQESAIAQSRDQLASAQEKASFAQGEAERYAPLARTGAETPESYAAKRNQARQAALDVAGQRSAVASAERRVETLKAQVRQAQAQGETAVAELAAANVNVQATGVTASVDGRIGDLTVRLGQYVQSGTRLMSVVPLAQLYITANFKETQIGRMRPGQPVTIEVDALSGIALHGHVESVAPGTGSEFSLIPPQNASGNFTKIVQRVPVRIALDAGTETRKVLVPGLSVKVSVDTIAAKDDVKQMKQQEEQDQQDQQRKGDGK